MRSSLPQTLADSISMVFFLQSLLALIESAYSFGLLSNDLPPEAIAVLFLFSPVLLWLVPWTPRPWQAKAIAAGAIGFRLAFPLADPGLRILFAGISVSCWLILLVLLINDGTPRFPSHLSASLGIALVALVLLRVAGSGLDWSLGGEGQLIAWPLGAFVLVVLLRTLASPRVWEGPGHGVGLLIPAAGLMGCIALILSIFSAPNVVARWGDFDYELMVGVLLAGVLVQRLLESRYGVTRRVLLWANLAMAASLTLTVLPQQIDFPSDQGSYPLDATDPGEWTIVAAAALMFLGPIVLRSAGFFALTIAQGKPSLRQCALIFTLGSVLLLALFFAQILTITYDYVSVVGPLFRDRFWAVAMVMGLVPFLALIRCRNGAVPSNPVSAPELLVLALLAAGALGGLVLLRASPSDQPSRNGSLTVVTFNIQQGFAADGRPGARDQLAALRNLTPDIVGLQESDTNKVSSGNRDVVRYFAERLDMYSYYGPSPVLGTFGVALLSRYPIDSPRTFYLWSEGEQTAAISARIRVGDRWFDVFVTHLGNGGPLAQQENVLQEIAGREDVLLLGDFNFRPGSDQYAATLDLLEDSWLRNQSAPDSVSMRVRAGAIDHIFVSPDVAVLNARYVDEGVSDHPIYVIEIAE